MPSPQQLSVVMSPFRIPEPDGMYNFFALTFDLSCLQLHSGSSEAEEENDPDGAYAFRRKAGCQYYAVSSTS